MAETLINTFKPFAGAHHPIEEITLIPSGGGRYEVTVDGELVYSKAATGVHTTNEYIVTQVRDRLKRASG
jgi:selenoprotein W-related protein